MPLADNQEKLLDTVADLHAEVEDMADGKADDYDSQIKALLFGTDGRDPEIWMSVYQASKLDLLGWPFEVWLELDLTEFNDIPAIERDAGWMMALSSLLTAAEQQVRVEILRDALKISGSIQPKINKAAKALNYGEIKEAAKNGVDNNRVNGAKERRRALLEIK